MLLCTASLAWPVLSYHCALGDSCIQGYAWFFNSSKLTVCGVPSAVSVEGQGLPFHQGTLLDNFHKQIAALPMLLL